MKRIPLFNTLVVMKRIPLLNTLVEIKGIPLFNTLVVIDVRSVYYRSLPGGGSGVLCSVFGLVTAL